VNIVVEDCGEPSYFYFANRTPIISQTHRLGEVVEIFIIRTQIIIAGFSGFR
jgi:hypothetical protein